MKNIIIFFTLLIFFNINLYSQIELIPKSNSISSTLESSDRLMVNDSIWVFKFTKAEAKSELGLTSFKILDELKLSKDTSNFPTKDFTFPDDVDNSTTKKTYEYAFTYFFNENDEPLPLYIKEIVYQQLWIPTPPPGFWSNPSEDYNFPIKALTFSYLKTNNNNLYKKIITYILKQHFNGFSQRLNGKTSNGVSTITLKPKPNFYSELMKNQMDYNIIQGNYFLYKYNKEYTDLYNLLNDIKPTAQNNNNTKNIFVDLLIPSRITFSHSLLKDPNFIGVMGLGFELNITPDRSWIYSSGVSPYLSISPIFLMKSMFWIFKLSEVKLSYNAKYNYKEYIKIRNRMFDGFEKHYNPKVNFNDGFSIEGSVAITKNIEDIVSDSTTQFLFSFPFINFYFASNSITGSKLDRPENMFSTPDIKYAYYFNQEYEVTTSLYLSLDEKKVNTLKFDIGLGGIQLVKAYYDENNKYIGIEKFITLSKIIPSIGISYNYLSNGINNTGAMFGVKAKFFNDRLKLNPWIKIYKSDPFEFRIEDMYVSKPIFRTYHEWEPPADNTIFFRILLNF